MGILIQFPQRGTSTRPAKVHSPKIHVDDESLLSAYRRDLARAVSHLVEHIESGGYDGIALILKPTSPDKKPALVVAGFYRHRLDQAADAAMHLRLAIKQRARDQSSQSGTMEVRVNSHSKHSHDGQP